MKPKTKAYLDKVIANPKMSQAQAYLETHETTNKHAARVNASKIINSPNALQYLATKSDIAEKTLYSVLRTANKQKENVNWQRLAKDSANDILDRVHGKPLTKTSNVNMNITLEEALNTLE